MGYEHSLNVESHRNPAPSWATVWLAVAVVTVGLAVVLQIWMTSFSISPDTCHYSPHAHHIFTQVYYLAGGAFVVTLLGSLIADGRRLWLLFLLIGFTLVESGFMLHSVGAVPAQCW